MIGIIGFNNLHIMQYLYKYTHILDQNHIDYEVVWWNRLGLDGDTHFDGTSIPFNYQIDTYQPFYKKIAGFLKYSHFMRKTIKQKKYDKLIILTTQTAIPLYDILRTKYKDKYIYDYRDITKEKNFGFYRKMVCRLFEGSSCTMISSKGFLEEIGVTDCSNVVMAHNTQKMCRKSDYSAKPISDGTINIVYWGMVRQVEYNKKVCDCFGNDKRFKLVYHGDGFYKELQDYCNNMGYDNIVFTGRYDLEEVSSFVNEADILDCLYENDVTQKPAMPVKAYDAIHYRLPVMINADSYVAEWIESSGAYEADIDSGKNITDEVYDWYKNLSVEDIERDYLRFEECIWEDDQRFADRVLEFCESEQKVMI